jgi:hypothetical protein
MRTQKGRQWFSKGCVAAIRIIAEETVYFNDQAQGSTTYGEIPRLTLIAAVNARAFLSTCWANRREHLRTERYGHCLVNKNLLKTQVNIFWKQNHRERSILERVLRGKVSLRSTIFFTKGASEPDMDSKSRGQKTILFFAFESGLTPSNRAC